MKPEEKYVYTPKCYAKVCEERPKTYSDYKTFRLSWGVPDHYEIVQKLGRGRYSEVYDGINTVNFKRCCIKLLKPIKRKRIRREIKILQILSSGPNIVQLYDMVKLESTKTTALIFEQVDNTAYKELYRSFTDFDVRYYTYQILLALHYCHSQGIMHRDIKPQNIMIDHSARKLRIIDWGLAEFYHHGTRYNVSVATRYYKGPELLVDDEYYDYSLDIWSLGVTFANMMLKKMPLFKGADNKDQLVKIAMVLGTKELMDYVNKYKLTLHHYFKDKLGDFPKIKWEAFINETNKDTACSDAIDLLYKMMRYDKEERITAKEALEHPYFLPVKHYLEQNKEKNENHF